MDDKEFAEFVNQCHEKEEAEGFSALTPLERTLHLVATADFEINLGGFSGFFQNSAADRVQEIIDALQTIGAETAADAVQIAVNAFPQASAVSQQEYRQTHIIKLSPSFRKRETLYSQQKPDVWTLLKRHAEAEPRDQQEQNGHAALLG